MKIYMMVGLTGSGKSTIAKKISEEKNIPYINGDTIFRLLHRAKCPFRKNAEISWKTAFFVLKMFDVSIFESNFVKASSRKYFIDHIRKDVPDVEFVAVCIDVPASIADQRFLEREKIDPDLYNVASGDFGTLEEITPEEGFSSVVKISNDADLKTFLDTISANDKDDEISFEEILFIIKMVIKRYGYKRSILKKDNEC